MASAAYEARNVRARALGYQSYYDYRAHGNGRIPPTQPALSGAALRAARGHTGPADLVREARPGDLVTAVPDPTSRGKDGTYSRVIVTLVGERGERQYVIRRQQMKGGRLDKLVGALTGAGAFFSPSPSLDLSQMISETEADE